MYSKECEIESKLNLFYIYLQKYSERNVPNAQLNIICQQLAI